MQKMKNKGRVQRFADVEQLEERIKKQSPKSGEYFYDYKLEEAQKEAELIDQQDFHSKFKINFADLPISQITLKGLTNRGFTKMTEVQRCSIVHALADRDVLVSSRTGSGKTLAYLIPLVQKLYRNRFIPMDGLGAIVIVPVRELAMQVFQVLNSFTQKLEISVGLVIGGKDVKFQQDRIKLMNILICTPGRLLHHLEQTYGFQTSNLKLLVIDEADVMLQMGFKEPLKAIMQQLPRCQTLLFSATVTKDIYALASLCTSQPQKILLQGVNSKQQQPSNKISGSYQTPAKLTQYYMVVSPEQKINTFYSFLKSHQKQKIVVFLSTCKQVRFLYESFRKFKLGSPLYELQGHQKQKKRMAMYFTFCEKRHGVLLCTNIAARGLDFPLVDWVFQLDIPDQTDTYVHRVGRTARYRSEGRSLVLVSQHELQFIQDLKKKGVQLHKISQNPQRYLRVESSLQSICSEHQDVKYLAQRSLISYLRFVHKAHDKKIFNLKKIDLQKLAHSFGLPSAPSINVKSKQQSDSDNQPQQNQGQEEQVQPKLSKIQRLRLKQKMKKMEDKSLKQKKEEFKKQIEVQQYDQQNDELLTVKRIVKNSGEKAPLAVSKRQLKKIKPEGHYEGRNKVYFDQQGNSITDEEYRRRNRIVSNREEVTFNTIQDMEERLVINKDVDDTVQKERRKLKRRKRDAEKQIRQHGYQEQVAILDQQSENQLQ